MRKLVVSIAGALLLIGTAGAGFTPGNWTDVGSHHLLGEPGNVILTYNFTGPDFTVGTFEWSGNGRIFGTSRPNETFCWITAPDGKNAGFQLSTDYLIEYFTSSGLSEFFNGTQAAGTWTFEFYESYDDYLPDPDAIHYNIQFTFNDDAIPVAEFPELETFNYGIPDDWTVVDNTGCGAWQLNSDFLRDNRTGGEGTCAMIDSDRYGFVIIDTELISPSFVVPLDDATLEFDHDFNWWPEQSDEVGYVAIHTEAGGWEILVVYEYADFNGHVSLDLSAYAGQEARIKFHYLLAYREMWWQVDNVAITPYSIPGDLDGDGDVDLSDLAALLAVYGLCEGDPGYDPAADLDGNGCVELADLAALLANYGQ